ncbi:MAG: AAA family ATPase, partial [Spirochaetales bacterium]|nr:AAA family ATPase [Candidatus Physcosoma equi]
MKNRKLIILLLVLIVGGALLAFGLDLLDFSTRTTYKEFYSAKESGTLSSVTFLDNDLAYTLTGDKTTYKTTNPTSPTLKEELLLSGVSIKEESDDLNGIFDMLFNVLFFGLVLFGLWKLVDYETNTFRVVKHTGVHFSDIAGMDGLKKEMTYAVSVLKDMKKAKGEGLRETRGIILEGAPGNGKTLFAKALAEEADVNFIATKGADFQGAVMGLGAFKGKMLFRKARRKKPCIVFIDEFDSIGEKRNYAGSGIDKENNRIITTLLNEMDGFTRSSGVLVIAATNSYGSLDEALVRPGRFDLKYSVGNPDNEARKQLVALYTRDKKLKEDVTPEILSIVFEGLSCSAIEAVLNEAQMVAKMRGMNEIDMT